MKDARKIIMRIWQANRAVDVFSYPKRSTRIPPIEGPTAALHHRMDRTGQASEGEQSSKTDPRAHPVLKMDEKTVETVTSLES